MKRMFILALTVFLLAACGTLTPEGLVFKTADPKLSICFRLHQAPPLPTVEPSLVPTVDPCTLVRGNETRDGRKLYHLPDMPNFAQVVPEMCFMTEQDAIDAGWSKAGN